VLKPEINSLSPSLKSKGERLVSANITIIHKQIKIKLLKKKNSLKEINFKLEKKKILINNKIVKLIS
jgi:hypothetical protein